MDGLDVSDEIVGTTTQNISQDSIQEYQISRSNLDLVDRPQRLGCSQYCHAQWQQ